MKKSKLNIKGIHHIHLTVRDPQKSKEFYMNVCDMEVWLDEKDSVGLTSKWLDTFYFTKPRDYLPKNRKFDRNNTGLDHFAFYVTSLKDLKNIEANLKKLKIEMEDDGITDDGFGGTAIFTKDPDGLKVEFHLVKED